ncbi:MAG: SIMPL domain-containing protein [Rubrivivax sp.]|nr:SIMPL domain-containing protein [Rubrivivax sp.]
MHRPVRRILIGLLAGIGVAVGSAVAQPLPPPQNVVSLAASASVEVAKDWLTVVFSTTREGADAATVQSQLRQALDVALTEARKAARPGQLEVQTGAFSLYPRYAPVDPKAPAGRPGIAGWMGSTELVVEGRDTQAIAQLTGRIQTLSIARVGFSLSREAREKVEGDVSAQAISRFRARADAVSRQFGFGGYTVREVNVSSNEPPGQMQPLMRAQAARAMAEESLPVEAGKAVVTATVSGSVQMEK